MQLYFKNLGSKHNNTKEIYYTENMGNQLKHPHSRTSYHNQTLCIQAHHTRDHKFNK